MNIFKIKVKRDNGKSYIENITADCIGDAISIVNSKFIEKFPSENHWETEVLDKTKII